MLKPDRQSPDGNKPLGPGFNTGIEQLNHQRLLRKGKRMQNSSGLRPWDQIVETRLAIP